jgi:DNA-binding MarR family transcriptional regulator
VIRYIYVASRYNGRRNRCAAGLSVARRTALSDSEVPPLQRTGGTQGGDRVRSAPEDVRPTIGVLAERLQIRPHSAVELVNRLAKGGFVRRRRDGETESSDRREVLLEMTAKGERVLRELSRHHGQELQQAGPALIAALQALLGTSMPMRANRGQTPPLNNRQQREGNSKWQRPILTMHRAPR